MGWWLVTHQRILIKNGNNYNQVGYYFYLSNGYKYSQGNVCQIFVGGSHGQQGTVIGMKYNKKKGEITLFKEKKIIKE